MTTRYFKLSFYLFLLILIAGATQIAYGDGECDSVKKLKEYFEKGAAAEKAGKLIDAFENYGNARFERSCEGENPVSSEATGGWKRTGKKLGDGEEKKGNLYKTGGLRKGAGAFQWFEVSENFVEADKVMMKMVRTKPDDTDNFSIAVAHFNMRKERSADIIKGYDYSVVHSYFKELVMIAIKNGDNALEREEKEIARDMIDINGSPVARSITQLKLARQWFDFYKDAKGKKVVDRALKRGDIFYADDKEPQSLEEAIEYYEVANDPAKINKVKDKANKLAVAAEKENALMRAVHYYRIAGDNDRASKLEDVMEEHGMKQQKEMLKDDKQKKKFKKEQEDMEKELGM